MKRLCITVITAVLLAGCESYSVDTPVVTIERDQYGTPHIFADSGYGVYYGYGYAVAQDRLFQMEMLKRTTQGMVAEVLGADYLELDTLIRTAYDTRSIQQQIDALSAADRDVLQGYADGFNRHVAAVAANPSELLPIEFAHYGFTPSQWNAFDVAMIFVGSIAHRYSDFNSELDNLGLLQSLESQHGKEKGWQIFGASKWLLDEDSPTTVPASERKFPGDLKMNRPGFLDKLASVSATTRVVRDESGQFLGTTINSELASLQKSQIELHGPEFISEFSPASNFWAVEAARVSDADGVMVNGPQFDWGTPSYVYGVGLHGGGFNVVGNTLLGMPCLLFAHNNDVGWGSTAGLSDQVDVYIETLHPEDDNQYLHNGVYKTFDSWSETIKVKDDESVTVQARKSVHGMVHTFDVEQRSATTRLRAWEGSELSSLIAWVNLAKDNSLNKVQKRLAGVTTNINFYYMDDKGNLGYTHGGKYPLRVANHDSRIPAPGTGEYDWTGFRSYGENPTTRNPEQGYIANWNNRPSADWISIDLWSYTWARGDRATLLFNALEEKPVFKADEIWGINQNITFADVTAPFLLPHLNTAMVAATLSETEQQALALLQGWDQQWLVDGNGNFGAEELIFTRWLSKLIEITLKDDIGTEYFPFYAATNTPDNPLGASMGTPPGAKVLIATLDDLAIGKEPRYDFFNGVDYNAVLRESFKEAVADLGAAQTTMMKNWTLKAAPMTWKPKNFRGVPQALDDAVVSIPSYANRGSENNYFIARDGNLIGYDVIPPGQSGFVNQDGVKSPNNEDQLEMFTAFELKRVPFTREEVEGLSTSTEVLPLNKIR